MILKQSPLARSELQDALRNASGWKGRNPEKTALLEQILATVANESFPGAIVPRLDRNRMVYYAVADTLAEWRNLQPLLRAAVGLTLSDFTGKLATLSPADSFEALLLQYDFAAAARFCPVEVPDLPRVMVNALVQLVDSVSQGGRAHREVMRTTAQVLHEFQLALSVGDCAIADHAIDFLRSHMRLDALNLYFLEVQRDAEFHAWDTLTARPFFQSVCQTRRPPRVTSALIEALYRTRLLSYDTAGDPVGAVDYFRAELQQAYERLFSVCPPNPRPAVAKAFLISTLANPSPDTRLIVDLQRLVLKWPAEEARFFHGLIAAFPLTEKPEQPVGSLNILHRLRSPNDDMTDAERARAALIGAAMLQTLEAARVAVDHVMSLAFADRDTLVNSPMLRGLWNDISKFAGHKGVPRNWLEWAEWLPELSFAEAACAEQAAAEWPIGQHLQSPDDVSALVVSLSRAWETAPERLWGALPHLVSWVRQDDQWPNSDYRLLYETLISLLMLSNNRSSAVLAAIATILEGCFALGMDQTAYKSTLDDLCRLIQEVASVRASDWILDAVELTVIHPCPDEVARTLLWNQVTVVLNQFRTRITPGQASLATDLARTLGMPETFPAPGVLLSSADSARVASRLPSGMVAVYTLTEGVGRRAKRVLEALFPDLRVELMHDTVASARLQHLARTADLMVVCWTAAKHAATGEIQQRRPQGMPLLFASGGGSSSVVREVCAYLLDQGT